MFLNLEMTDLSWSRRLSQFEWVIEKFGHRMFAQISFIVDAKVEQVGADRKTKKLLMVYRCIFPSKLIKRNFLSFVRILFSKLLMRIKWKVIELLFTDKVVFLVILMEFWWRKFSGKKRTNFYISNQIQSSSPVTCICVNFILGFFSR